MLLWLIQLRRGLKINSYKIGEDYHQECSYWAGMGECSENPSYMLYTCPKACENCESHMLEKSYYSCTVLMFLNVLLNHL